MKRLEAAAALAALAHETRLDIFRMLVRAGRGGLAAGTISSRVGLAPPTLSFHLSQLGHAGLVAPRRAGRSIIYAANYPAMNALLGYLTENCCAGTADACAPATLNAVAPSPARLGRLRSSGVPGSRSQSKG